MSIVNGNVMGIGFDDGFKLQQYVLNFASRVTADGGTVEGLGCVQKKYPLYATVVIVPADNNAFPYTFPFILI